MDNMKHRRLQELDRSDFEIIKGEPDIRGWDVKNATGQLIGEVEELIIDAQKKKVRYMVVELDDDDLDLEDDKKVLIPIGLAELDKDDDDVILPSVTFEQLKALPAYDVNNLDEEAERRICAALGRQEETGSTTTTASAASAELGTPEYYANFYQHAYFNDENLYRKRDQETRSQDTTVPADYEHGLRLWELRSEGGIIPADATQDTRREKDISDERRMQMIQDRRRAYEERRFPIRKKNKSIIQRIKDEGLRDASR